MTALLFEKREIRLLESQLSMYFIQQTVFVPAMTALLFAAREIEFSKVSSLVNVYSKFGCKPPLRNFVFDQETPDK